MIFGFGLYLAAWTNSIFDLEKIFLFSSGNLFFTFFTNAHCKFWKDVNVIMHGKTVTFQIPRPVFSRLEISMVLMEVF